MSTLIQELYDYIDSNNITNYSSTKDSEFVELAKKAYQSCSSLKELTDGNALEIVYSISDSTSYWFLPAVCEDLRKIGLYSSNDTSIFSKKLKNALKEFQIQAGIGDYDGILNDVTLQALRKAASYIAGDTITGEDGVNYEDNIDSTDSSGIDNIGAHYGQFFSEQNSKQFRQNKRDIRIVLGDGTVTKTIKDVYMRSVSVDVDASGNPISETYEFIAKDVIETDNPEDYLGYTASGEDLGDYYNMTQTDFTGYTTGTKTEDESLYPVVYSGQSVAGKFASNIIANTLEKYGVMVDNMNIPDAIKSMYAATADTITSKLTNGEYSIVDLAKALPEGEKKPDKETTKKAAKRITERIDTDYCIEILKKVGSYDEKSLTNGSKTIEDMLYDAIINGKLDYKDFI